MLICVFLSCRVYCAPEYVLEGKSSSKSDIYSLGVLVIELVTGSKKEPDLTKVRIVIMSLLHGHACPLFIMMLILKTYNEISCAGYFTGKINLEWK